MAEMSLDSRMNRLIGQLEGIRRMIKGKRSTDDVVQQIMAAGQALSRIGMLLLKEELVRAVTTGAKRSAGAQRGAGVSDSKGGVTASTRGANGGAKSKNTGSNAKTLSGTVMKQSDLDSRTAKNVEKMLEKLFKM